MFVFCPVFCGTGTYCSYNIISVKVQRLEKKRKQIFTCIDSIEAHVVQTEELVTKGNNELDKAATHKVMQENYVVNLLNKATIR